MHTSRPRGIKTFPKGDLFEPASWRDDTIMDRQLRRAPDAAWALTHRLGLSRKRIAKLVRAEPAAVGYRLVMARRQDPGLEAAHLTPAGTKPSPSPAGLARMEAIINWVADDTLLRRRRSLHANNDD
ncbi:MAG: hypothetical protein ABWY04_03900 [Arthrobacter sp.]